jgi:DNA-binding NtrC family response regulator
MNPDIESLSKSGKDLKSLLEEYERGLILAALDEHGGNQRQAAAALGILPTTLHEKLKRLGVWRRTRAESRPVEREVERQGDAA